MIVGLIPAAGSSRRMGAPKLPMLAGGSPMIARAVRALIEGGADRVVVIAPPLEVAGASEVARLSREAGAEVVSLVEPTPDMRSTFLRGLDAIERSGVPASVVLTPGDCPGIGPSLVSRLLAIAREEPDRIVAPSYESRRGHPIVLPWSIALKARDLGPDVGLNTLIAGHAALVRELVVDAPTLHTDIDTPEDLDRWNRRS